MESTKRINKRQQELLVDRLHYNLQMTRGKKYNWTSYFIDKSLAMTFILTKQNFNIADNLIA